MNVSERERGRGGESLYDLIWTDSLVLALGSANEQQVNTRDEYRKGPA